MEQPSNASSLVYSHPKDSSVVCVAAQRVACVPGYRHIRKSLQPYTCKAVDNLQLFFEVVCNSVVWIPHAWIKSSKLACPSPHCCSLPKDYPPCLCVAFFVIVCTCKTVIKMTVVHYIASWGWSWSSGFSLSHVNPLSQQSGTFSDTLKIFLTCGI